MYILVPSCAVLLLCPENFFIFYAAQYYYSVQSTELKFRERFCYDKVNENWILNRLQIALYLPKSMVIS
jgi:hypothetical protein